MRLPPPSTFESWIEREIREAQERGVFDDLPGAGKPLPGLDEPHDPLWWVKRKIRDENLSLLPDQRIAHLNAHSIDGPPTTLAPVDIEAAVRRWRSR